MELTSIKRVWKNKGEYEVTKTMCTLIFRVFRHIDFQTIRTSDYRCVVCIFLFFLLPEISGRLLRNESSLLLMRMLNTQLTTSLQLAALLCIIQCTRNLLTRVGFSVRDDFFLAYGTSTIEDRHTGATRMTVSAHMTGFLKRPTLTTAALSVEK